MYKFNDEVIAEVARLLQLALLTGTDIVDNLRQLEVESKDDVLFLTENYKNEAEDRLNTMQDFLNNAKNPQEV
jgi:hypothetical protein